VKDVIASYEALTNLFERIHFFLQRLNHYAAVPLTPEMTLLLGKIMAQVLSVLALSTKEMKERRISESICSMLSFITDYETEKFMKGLVGRTDVEDGLARLDMLTKEENLMTAARNLEVTHRVDANVTATQELTHRVEEVVHVVDGNVKETKELTQSIHDDVKVTKHGEQSSMSSYTLLINLYLSYVEIAMDEQKRSFLTVVPTPTGITEVYTQVNRCKLNFGHGSLPQTLPSIIILHATSSTKVQQCGSSKVANSTSGRKKVRYCGSVVIVSFFLLFGPFMTVNIFPDLSAGSGKSILWCVISQQLW